MVFNCIAVNQDDHVKNISFLMDRNGTWTLSPAYDLTFSYNLSNKWLRAHQMTINGKNTNINREDLLIAGKNMGIKANRCKEIINQVTDIVKQFPDYAKEVGIKEKTINSIQLILEKNIKLF